ncbi:uncharacterized protein ARMOST_01687 [Armillaria ostoyae]|uniref:Transcription activator of gluconeogenesis ERT1 n=1 Tax=Armillaria ostoyae TaxID=47428 RepID=A0A284QPT2_ARMOS|nr:uncharacterized protein ARMOST_01687 [Armillaria ostoyae]
MTTEQPKPADPPVAYPMPPHFQHYNGGTFPPPPPPGVYPPMFAYPPPVEGHPEGGPPPGLIMFHAPPGMVYAYPPPPGQVFAVPPGAPSPSMLKPKRKQVKMACTNCATACKRCDEARPCERCLKYGIQDSCIDGQRKERKKGVKRGPYKRKNKGMDPTFSDGEFPQPAPPENGEWQATGSNSPPANASTTAAAIHAVAQFAAPPPEAGAGYYPLYYPPGHFVTQMPEGQEGQPQVVQYFMGGYPPPYGYAPPPGAAFVPAPPMPGQSVEVPNGSDKPAESATTNNGVVIAASDGADPLSRKRGRASNGSPGKSKKTKTSDKDPGSEDVDADKEDSDSLPAN